MTAISCVVVSSQRRHEPSKTRRVSDEQGQNNSDATTLLLVMTCLIAKTEVLWCSSARRQFQIPIGPVRVGNASVLPASAVRDLGVYIDTDVTMRAHVSATVRACFAALRQISSVRRSLSRDALAADIASCTGGQQGWLLLLSVSWNFRHTVTATTVCHECRRTPGVLGEEVGTHNNTPPWTALAASQVSERIQFRLCVLVYRCLNGTAPPYLAETLRQSTDVDASRRLRSAAT